MPCQPLTATLGSPYSRPGAIQPGYFYTGTAIWRGTWPMLIALGSPNGDPVVHQIGAQFALAPSVASQVARGDPGWWVLH